jgi:hypothetical protein
MLSVVKRLPINVNLADYISAKGLAKMMDIYEVSAEELMSGELAFEEDEVRFLFSELGIYGGDNAPQSESELYC